MRGLAQSEEPLTPQVPFARSDAMVRPMKRGLASAALVYREAVGSAIVENVGTLRPLKPRTKMRGLDLVLERYWR